MHEVSLCESVVELLEEQAEIQGYSRVRRVWLEIGRLAGVEIEAMRFGFDAVAKGTIADGAGLDIIEIPGRAHCPACRRDVVVTQRFDVCPHCGMGPLTLIGGDRMRVLELEVE